MELDRWIEASARMVEVVGVATIVLGGVVAVFMVLLQARRDLSRWLPLYRRYLGHAILLGLEFLVAADIIRTVSHLPELENVLVLAIIVAIRTFLSFTLEVEIEGRWPWKTGPLHKAGGSEQRRG